MMNRAVFLDRDGVINKWEEPQGEASADSRNWYCLSWDEFEWAEGAIEGLKLLAETEYKLIVVSNQSCINKGLIHKSQVINIFDRMRRSLGRTNTGQLHTVYHRIDGYYFCPHDPEENCACRKPRPGMVFKAAVEHEIDLTKSWMVGDSVTDFMAAEKTGIPTWQFIAIADEPFTLWGKPVTKKAPNLFEAAKLIIAEEVITDDAGRKRPQEGPDSEGS